MSKKGFSTPIVLLFVSFFLVVPVLYFIYNKISVAEESVKGVANRSEETKSGLAIYVNSNETWDMFQYVCENIEDCKGSLASGKRWGTVSGGSSELYRVKLPTKSDWGNDKFMKIYVKPGWMTSSRQFYAEPLVEEGVQLEQIELDGQNYDVVIIDLEAVKGQDIDLAIFKDEK